LANLPNTEYLYEANTPAIFWRLMWRPGPSQVQWISAIEAAMEMLPPPALSAGVDVAHLLAQTLGEGQFGVDHWQLSPAKRLYYQLKPILPRKAIRTLRQIQRLPMRADFLLRWPIEDRYAGFQWEIMRQLLEITGRRAFPFIHFWPERHRFALVLTHDIETAEGQANVRMVADLEEGLGFCSSFNFVAERYRLEQGLMQELRGRGFEIGVHGLKHDGKLFSSQAEFSRRAARINKHLKEFGAVGFRAPLTHRQPEWMQELEVEYDLSFFDTDPYEPIPGGTMCIWPFMMGRFVELPYTLAQDYTLTAVLGETTPRVWLQKIAFIKDYCGMALVNTHPDYLKAPDVRRVYVEFLQEMRTMDDYWHALPRDVARWWKARAFAESMESLPGAVVSELRMSGKSLVIEPEVRNPPTQQ
jgi:hypothetical protein